MQLQVHKIDIFLLANVKAQGHTNSGKKELLKSDHGTSSNHPTLYPFTVIADAVSSIHIMQ